MSIKKIKFNLIQDIATPHNNNLIEQFIKNENVEIDIYYEKNQDSNLYQWSKDISNEHLNAFIYGSRINLPFLVNCLRRKNEKFIIVGWANINTKLLLLLFFLLRRPFNYWTDCPLSNSSNSFYFSKYLKSLAYKILLFSNCNILCVGITTISFFRKIGFPEKRLINFPIFVKIDDNPYVYRSFKESIRFKYLVPEEGLLISAGSRLIFEKGFDILIHSISLLNLDVRNKIKLVIVGTGDQYDVLVKQIIDLGLNEVVILEKWLDIEDFKTLIANSDIFIHPARFDAYGGTIFAMSLGVPVIGSTGAGAALDRINHGINGFLFEPSNVLSLSKYIEKLFYDSTLRLNFSANSLDTALNWKPSKGVEILVNQAI